MALVTWFGPPGSSVAGVVANVVLFLLSALFGDAVRAQRERAQELETLRDVAGSIRAGEPAELEPQPGLGDLDVLVERLRSPELDVHDEGQRRRTPTGNGSGLLGMRERAASVGGEVDARPAQGGGWHVTATLPDVRSAS